MKMNKKKNIFITGPIFNTLSGPSGQGGLLYSKLKEEGYWIRKKSAIKNPYLRFIDTILGLSFYLHKIDIVFIQGFALRAFILEDLISRIVKIFNKESVLTIRGGAFIEFFDENNVWCNKVLNRVTHITTPSKYIINELNKRGVNKIKYIPNFISLEHFSYKPLSGYKTKKILWVRAFNDIYHPELAIETISQLKQIHENIHLTMIGPDMGTLKKCKELICKLNLEKNISIIGQIPNKQLQKYYHSHAIYINTTRYESFGVALIEAAACGIPTVSTKVGEIPFIRKDRDNILFSKDNSINFAENINELLNDETFAKRIAHKAKIATERYTWKNIKIKWSNLLIKE